MEAALDVLNTALKIDPNNAALLRGVSDVTAAIERGIDNDDAGEG